MPPKVDEKKCNGCGACVAVCPVSVFEMENKKSKVKRPDDCIECEACVQSCSEGAIELKKKE